MAFWCTRDEVEPPSGRRRTQLAGRMAGAVGWVLAAAAAAGAASIDQVHTHGSFETAGVIVTLAADDGDESLRLEVKGPSDADFHEVHPFVRYDRHAFASSLFELESDSVYDLRITLDDPDSVLGSNPVNAQVRTRAPFALPAGARVVHVSPDGKDVPGAGGSVDDAYATIQYAVDVALPGDKIRVCSRAFTAQSPWRGCSLRRRAPW